ncbi:MAG: transcriptional regulator [Halobacteriovoraceae bacterium]|nr:transcriptional regulator [Halobacteriovoraceae bacterium]|tara:strand:- start:1068 stop:1364 length:297 start_codon:yes stop_codon:yes gene_type:complete
MSQKDFVRAKINKKLTPGQMLKTLRGLQELSQAVSSQRGPVLPRSELAELAGMSQSNISALESGVRQIGRERALALAIALKVHPAVILFPDFDLKDVA